MQYANLAHFTSLLGKAPLICRERSDCLFRMLCVITDTLQHHAPIMLRMPRRASIVDDG
jgi:hypothetical protein